MFYFAIFLLVVIAFAVAPHFMMIMTALGVTGALLVAAYVTFAVFIA